MKALHLNQLVAVQAKNYGDRAALWSRNYHTGTWESVSWNQFLFFVNQTARALAAIGVKEKDNIALCSPNLNKMLYADFAIYSNRAVSVPIYATSTVEQVAYIVNDAQIETIFVGEQFQYNVAYKVAQSSTVLKNIIILSDEVIKEPEDQTSLFFTQFIEKGSDKEEKIVQQRVQMAKEDDLACILYTSGTTGEPKGVMLEHGCFIETWRTHSERLKTISDKDTSFCFLPLTHILEKAWTYFALWMGMEVYINKIPQDVLTTIKEVRPTIMCNVPRFWEKVYAGVQEKINDSKGIKRKLFEEAIKVGYEYNLNYIQKGLTPPKMLSLKFKFFDKVIYSTLKKVIGIDRGNFFPTAGAPLSDELNVFFQSVNIPILYGYGLTESTATVSCFWKEGYRLGSVGEIMPGVEIKIGENNEILLKGKTITKGYYNKPEENAKSFVDGWFKTGDAGSISTDGRFLYMTERIKDLFKTANGKYIAPQALEMAIGLHPLVEQVAIIADQRKFVSALIVPSFSQVKKIAIEKGITYTSIERLLGHPLIEQEVGQALEMQTKKFASFEKVKKFLLLSEPFSLENGELTNTLKLKRRILNERYAQQIEGMYKEVEK